ncbi:uncharacterized protein N7446_010625 [Penicillium canescens]|uniref:uncharacterized protein n=1 Tax=Penicillium canescens TaxID=5083 RepID=UPI0026E08B7F|nr:uncharacterized protein N7446_010625 [Penicillium canescens]KAJ6050516.1 hypothetical protein N7446_010625 [Penicillium canescens]
MLSPEPYSFDTLDNYPLAADGSDFPCKLRDNAFEAPETETTIGVGESHELIFQGSAMHGGGSCQISLTTDLEPSKNSEWKVIRSFVGGCPANVEGNLAGGSARIEKYPSNFTIPCDISPGKYTLAWTWFNRLGNREMYMNCAPITVTTEASSGDSVKSIAPSSTLPAMFVANVNGCITKEGVDIRFPEPGEKVEFKGQPSNLAPEGEPACTGNPTFGVVTSSSISMSTPSATAGA